MALLAAAPALGQEREYCPVRPGLGDTPCTIAPGHVSVETGIAAWERDDNADERSDTVDIGETTVRFGLDDHTDVGIDWTPYGHVRTRDKLDGAIDHADGVGDVTLSLRRNLRNPDGKGFSVAVIPYVVVPVGTSQIGGGDWAGGLIVPMSYDLAEGLTLSGTSEVAAAADEDGDGQHFQARQVVGLDVDLSKKVTAIGELELLRDDDPSDHTTQARAALSLAWKARDDLQLDLGAVAGLNRDTPDLMLTGGVSRRF